MRIGIALRASALSVAWLVSLAIAWGELSASILVVPAGVTTIPIRVFGLLHSGVTNQAAALCLTSMLGFLLVAAVIQWLSGTCVATHVARQLSDCRLAM